MAKFLKFIVNTIMILAIVVAASLLIPPFAGVTTVIVDDIEMETNLEVGSVTYAWGVDAEELKAGDKVLLQEDGDMVYSITSVSGVEFVLEDKLSTDGDVLSKELQGIVEKVVVTVPVLGYVSMALRTVEGLIIVGLSVVFVIILFILAEIWRKEEEEDWEDDEEDEASDQKETPKAENSKAEAPNTETPKAEDSKTETGESVGKAEENSNVAANTAVEDSTKETSTTDSVADDFSKAEQDLFEETSSFLAADIASLMGLDTQQTEKEGTQTNDMGMNNEIFISKSLEKEVREEPKEKVLAMPLYTKEELLERAKVAGDEPELVMDELSGVTFLDYSDVL